MFEKGHITPIGPDVFRMQISPWDLYGTSQGAPEDQREAWEGFAHDLAVIRELPVIPGSPATAVVSDACTNCGRTFDEHVGGYCPSE